MRQLTANSAHGRSPWAEFREFTGSVSPDPDATYAADAVWYTDWMVVPKYGPYIVDESPRYL